MVLPTGFGFFSQFWLFVIKNGFLKSKMVQSCSPPSSELVYDFFESKNGFLNDLRNQKWFFEYVFGFYNLYLVFWNQKWFLECTFGFLDHVLVIWIDFWLFEYIRLLWNVLQTIKPKICKVFLTTQVELKSLIIAIEVFIIRKRFFVFKNGYFKPLLVFWCQKWFF